MNITNIIIGYFVIINMVGFFSMAVDKFKAVHNKWRIPEKTLFTIALIGGSIGSILGMQVFRHKTKHTSFTIGMPVILIMQIVLILLIHFKI